MRRVVGEESDFDSERDGDEAKSNRIACELPSESPPPFDGVADSLELPNHDECSNAGAEGEQDCKDMSERRRVGEEAV